MDKVDRSWKPIKKYNNTINELEYSSNLLKVNNHKLGTFIFNVFNVNTTDNITSFSQSSDTNKELLKIRFPFEDNTGRRHNPKLVHINYTISENYINLIVSKLTGIREKHVDITGFSINSDNQYFKRFYKTFSKKANISKIDIEKFDIFCEIRFSKRKGLYVFNDYLENPDGVVYYENGIKNHTSNQQLTIGYDEVDKPHGEKTTELKMIENEKNNDIISVFNTNTLTESFFDKIQYNYTNEYNIDDFIIKLNEHGEKFIKVCDIIKDNTKRKTEILFSPTIDVDIWSKKTTWCYIITFDKFIVKIGSTGDGLKGRTTSYLCGTKENRIKGTCSTTNYIIYNICLEYINNGIDVEMYAYEINTPNININIFGKNFNISPKLNKNYEKELLNKYIEISGNKPFLSRNS